MSLLLDTCALLALARGDLTPSSTAALHRAAEVHVPMVCPWEVAIRAAEGKLRLFESPFQWYRALVDHYHLREVQLDAETLCAAAALPMIHRDPFDRVIVAIASAQSLTVVTSDENIPKYPGVQTLW